MGVDDTAMMEMTTVDELDRLDEDPVAIVLGPTTDEAEIEVEVRGVVVAESMLEVDPGRLTQTVAPPAWRETTPGAPLIKPVGKG